MQSKTLAALLLITVLGAVSAVRLSFLPNTNFIRTNMIGKMSPTCMNIWMTFWRIWRMRISLLVMKSPILRKILRTMMKSTLKLVPRGPCTKVALADSYRLVLSVQLRRENPVPARTTRVRSAEAGHVAKFINITTDEQRFVRK